MRSACAQHLSEPGQDPHGAADRPKRPPGARLAVSLIFFAIGTGFAAWAAALPTIKARLALTDGELGIALFAFALGAIVVMPFAGLLVVKLGARVTTTAAGLSFAGLLAMVPASPDITQLVAGACLMGVAQGILDVAMNLQATALDRAGRTPILASIHALFYVGGLIGATIAAQLFTIGWQATDIAVTLAGIVALAIIGASFARPAISRSADPRLAALLPRGAVLHIGVLVFLGFLVEGAMMDWGTVYVASLEDVPPGVPALSFAVFAGGIIAGRLTGDRLTTLWGERTLLRASGLVAAGGMTFATLMTDFGGGPGELRDRRHRPCQLRSAALRGRGANPRSAASGFCRDGLDHGLHGSARRAASGRLHSRWRGVGFSAGSRVARGARRRTGRAKNRLERARRRGSTPRISVKSGLGA